MTLKQEKRTNNYCENTLLSVKDQFDHDILSNNNKGKNQ